MAKDTKKGLGRGLSELFGDDILDNESEGELDVYKRQGSYTPPGFL